MAQTGAGEGPQASVSRDTAAMMQFQANKKSVGVAYLLWFFFGMLGAHRFYLGRTGSAVAILVLSIAAFVLSYVVIGIIIVFVPMIWVLVDLFLIPGITREFNNGLIARL